MAKYTVRWVEKIIVFAQHIEAESEDEAIEIAKNRINLDIDTEPMNSKPTKYEADLE